MTLNEALAIAAQAKPKRPVRVPMDKLQRTTTAADISAGVVALNKSYAAMGGTLAKAQGQISQIAADVEYLANFTPGSPVRRMHS